MKSSEVLQKLSDICRLKHLSYATEKSYAGWVRSYMQQVAGMPAGWTSEQKAGEFLTGIAKSGGAAATQSQALNALSFLYGKVLGTPLGNVEALRVRRPAAVRTALAVAEVRALLAEVEDVAGYPTRLVVRLKTRSIASWRSFSVTGSTLAVASSKMTMAGSRAKVRARATI